MRSNMPVTNVEYVLKDTETIVSKTDLHGNITYVNQDFINISGFSEDELLGAPQNIVRHPDMPVEAFADFWSTLQKRQGVDRAGEEPLQERRSLLGGGQCRPHHRKPQDRRLCVDSDQSPAVSRSRLPTVPIAPSRRATRRSKSWMAGRSNVPSFSVPAAEEPFTQDGAGTGGRLGRRPVCRHGRAGLACNNRGQCVLPELV